MNRGRFARSRRGQSSSISGHGHETADSHLSRASTNLSVASTSLIPLFRKVINETLLKLYYLTAPLLYCDKT